jgi:hypothetical protein
MPVPHLSEHVAHGPPHIKMVLGNKDPEAFSVPFIHEADRTSFYGDTHPGR